MERRVRWKSHARWAGENLEIVSKDIAIIDQHVIFYDDHGKDMVVKFMSIVSPSIKTETIVPITRMDWNQHHARSGTNWFLNSASGVLGGDLMKVRANNKVSQWLSVVDDYGSSHKPWPFMAHACHHQIQMVSTCLISTKNWISKSWTENWEIARTNRPEPCFWFDAHE